MSVCMHVHVRVCTCCAHPSVCALVGIYSIKPRLQDEESVHQESEYLCSLFLPSAN